jgi:hypothetical protein
MTITRRKQKPSEADTEAFISGAPDAEPEQPEARKGVKKGNKVQISLTIAPALLERVDALAADLGQSRAGIINLAIHRVVEHGVQIDGRRGG